MVGVRNDERIFDVKLKLALMGSIDMDSILEIESKFGIKIIPVEIKGNRWSCIQMNKIPLPVAKPVKIQISATKGYIIYSSVPISPVQESALELRLRKLDGELNEY